MQDRYVPDFGDYVKLAILRALVITGRRLSIAWWLLPDEGHNRDGRHRAYLQAPTKWRAYDPELFDALVKIEQQGPQGVRAYEDAGLLPNSVFVADMIPCDAKPYARRPEERRIWLVQVASRLRDCDLIFLDPDNGIASPALKMTQRRAGKSVWLHEIAALYERGRVLVVYHHHTRREGGHESELQYLAEQLKQADLPVIGALRAKPWSPRAFFIVGGDDAMRGRAEDIAKRWVPWITWHKFR